MSEKKVAVNSAKAWILAARPKTLSGAAVPVLIGGAMYYAISSFALMHGLPVDIPETASPIVPFVLAFLFALIMQIDANFINDYFDFKKGGDTNERIGPERACAEGWITLKAMKKGILITSAAACLAGFPLIYFGGWWMLAVGAVSLLFAFIYTTHLSARGLGDLLVFLFFGIVPVFFTYYTMGGRYIDFDVVRHLYNTDIRILLSADMLVVLAGISIGAITDCLLIVNNYRDIDLDAKVGKKTLAVAVGRKWSRILYAANGWIGILLMVFICFMLRKGGSSYLWVIPVIFQNTAYICLTRAHGGKELNAVLGQTARNILIFGFVFAILLIVR